ncbi:hypothetical protein [Nonlabens agnitus]|uniref:Uncharacterized protein n=1 Tax=Nonlabens agnitus TaxID=870484 RepID=A0A2S9WRY1_9FLAO|nr:hypothetical protein [Nonlabens agnitus]PRP66209.1 hypothetical protein BST86_03430 [Nonlabens agnitus]
MVDKFAFAKANYLKNLPKKYRAISSAAWIVRHWSRSCRNYFEGYFLGACFIAFPFAGAGLAADLLALFGAGFALFAMMI